MVRQTQELYSKRVGVYERFVSVFLYPQGLRSFFMGLDLLRKDVRILDAGCGTGIVTFALLDALNRLKRNPIGIQGFDSSAQMLAQFQEKMKDRDIESIDICQANVLDLQQLPSSWNNYDLIVSASMLEYIPRKNLSSVLFDLRSHLSEDGYFLLFISRKNWLMKILVGWLWSANLYSRKELEEAFVAAGFKRTTFKKFPLKFFHLNIWGHVVQAK